MHSVALLLCLIASTHGGWLRDLVSTRGWHLGDGLVLHLLDSGAANGTFLERHSMVMNYGGQSVSVAKARSKRALEVGFYPDLGEARGQKHGSMLSILIGYKLATIVALILSAMGIFVLKALSVAKVAIVTSVILLLAKLLHHHKDHHQNPGYMEIEPAPLVPVDFASEVEYHPSAASNFYSIANLAPESSGNATTPQVTGVSRRRDAPKKRKTSSPFLTIHQYSVAS